MSDTKRHGYYSEQQQSIIRRTISYNAREQIERYLQEGEIIEVVVIGEHKWRDPDYPDSDDYQGDEGYPPLSVLGNPVSWAVAAPWFEGWGLIDGTYHSHAFRVWTNRRVLFTAYNHKRVWIESVYRDPPSIGDGMTVIPEHIGGY